MNTQTILASCPLFAELGTESLRAVSAASQYMKVPKKSIIFVEEDKGISLYVLGTGSVQLHKTAEDGSETVIKVVQAGESFAEVILFEKQTYPVTATALNDVELIAVPRDAVLSLLRQETFRNEFIAALLRRQRYLAQKLHEMAVLDVEERFFRFIREHFGIRESIDVTLSKKDMAAAIGTVPETLSRLILRLEQEGVISWEGKTLILHDTGRLR